MKNKEMTILDMFLIAAILMLAMSLIGCALSVNINLLGKQPTHYISPDGIASEIGTAKGIESNVASAKDNTSNVDAKASIETEAVIGKKEVNSGEIPEKKGLLRSALDISIGFFKNIF